ncbi:MAG: hypothetical protein JEZ01_04415 [Labilibaculum sp.]|nr:hypothetical protein [Labilibaculum sp.]MBI9056996.1 hypothetical protein [Labilibaculum sp.]
MKNVQPTIHEKLSHLTSEQIEELIREFYNSHKSTHLIEKYKIDYSSGLLHKILPPEVIEDECKFCEISLWRKRKRKRAWSMADAHCPECGHIDTDDCKCPNCVREKVEKLKCFELVPIDFLDLSSSKNRETRDFKSLTLREKLFVSSLLCVSDVQDDNLYKLSLDFWKLAPNEFYQKRILRYMVEEGIVEFTIDKSLDILIKANSLEKIPVNFLQYKFVLKGDIDTKDLKNPNYELVSELEINSMWLEIAIEECLDFAIYRFKQENIIWSPAENDKLRIREILENFSISQFCYVLNKLFKNHFTEYEKGRLPFLKWLDGFFFGISRYFIASNRDGWEIRNRMPADITPSVLSVYFYRKVLNMTDEAYLIPPGKYKRPYNQ